MRTAGAVLLALVDAILVCGYGGALDGLAINGVELRTRSAQCYS